MYNVHDSFSRHWLEAGTCSHTCAWNLILNQIDHSSIEYIELQCGLLFIRSYTAVIALQPLHMLFMMLTWRPVR
jgi:hypothetical protein